MMLRTKLALLIVALLVSVVTLGVVLHFGMQKVEYYSTRAQLAYTALEANLRLSQNVYRHFKEQLDIVVKDLDPENPESLEALEQLKQSLVDLKAAARREIVHVARNDAREQEVTQIERAADLEALIWEGVRSFERIHRLQRQGQEQDARRHLKELLDVLIDKRLRPLIDQAVADERAEVALADRQLAATVQRLRTVAAMVGMASVLFAFAAGILLVRRLKRPLDDLMRGLRAIAAGDLAHRIHIEGRDEIAQLASHINTMSQELGEQRGRLMQAQTELETKVADRTVELLDLNTRLRRIDESRRQFFADVSHELRTPLTVIRGEAEVTLRGGRIKEIDEYRSALTRIVGLTEQLSGLVDDLLFLARSEAGGARFNPSRVEMNGLIAEAWEDAIAVAHNKRLEVTLALSCSELYVRGDRMRLKQVLRILLDNAIRYSTAGTVIDLVLEAADERAVVRVVDRGMGIAESEQGKVFERFFRGEAARRAVPAGSGLGLALAKSIIDMHEGAIALSTRENEGTTVTIELPLCADEGDVTQ